MLHDVIIGISISIVETFIPACSNHSSGNDFMKRNVFNCLLKEKREVAVVNEHASMLAECMVHIV